MKKFDLVQATQILANLGVVVGIAFLALETDQNSRVTVAQTRLNLITIENDILSTLSEDEELVDLVLKGESGVELSPVQEFQFIAFYQRGFRVLEWVYLELPDERPRVALRRVVLQTPLARRAWDSEKSVYDSDFVAFMEEGLPRSQ